VSRVHRTAKPTGSIGSAFPNKNLRPMDRNDEAWFLRNVKPRGFWHRVLGK
jgi:hypothetical protein